jgi:hypothetical protein
MDPILTQINPLYSMLIILSRLRLSLTNDLFPSSFMAKISYIFTDIYTTYNLIHIIIYYTSAEAR